jgi:hypothetical protein
MNMKKIIVSVGILVVLLISITSVAFAAGLVKSPAEILAGLTGKTAEEVAAARQEGSSYGEQAASAGKLDEFKDARLEQFKLRLDEAVKAGQLTQAQADERYAAMQTRLESCTGSCTGTGAGIGGQGLRMGRSGQGGLGGQGSRAGCGMGGLGRQP